MQILVMFQQNILTNAGKTTGTDPAKMANHLISLFLEKFADIAIFLEFVFQSNAIQCSLSWFSRLNGTVLQI